MATKADTAPLLTSPTPVATATQRTASPSFWTRFGYEILVSMLITLVFAFPFFYDLGIGHGIKYTTTRVSAVTYAFVVGASLWFIYSIVTAVARYQVRGNPFISTTVAGMAIGRAAGNEKTQDEVVRILFELAGEFLAQTIGAGIAAVGAWLIGAFKINHIQNVILRNIDNGSPVALTDIELYAPNDAQIIRVFIAEFVGLVALIAVTAYGYNVLTCRERFGRVMDASLYGKLIGLVYFFYVLLFFVHSKLTIDPIRGGWFCLVAVFNTQSEQCARLYDGASHASLFLLVWAVQALVAIFSIPVIAILEIKYDEACKSQVKNK